MKITQNEIEKIARAHYGVVPPMVKQMYAISPPVAFHYLIGVTALSDSAFSEVKQQAIQLKVSSLNDCESCIKGHSFLLKNTGMDQNDIASIRHGLPTSDPNMNRLMAITELVFLGGRNGFETALDELGILEATKEEVFEVTSLIASKTISNYINNYSLALKEKTATHN